MQSPSSPLQLFYLLEHLEGVKSTCAFKESLCEETEAGNHCQAPMLHLGLLESECLCWLRCKVQWVEETTWIAALFWVKFAVTEEFHSSHQKGVGDCQLVDAERNAEAEPRWALQLSSDGILPSNSSVKFVDNDAQSTQHGPAAVLELALTEAGKAEDLRVWLEWSAGVDLVNSWGECTNNASCFVHSRILIELININLEIFDGLGKSKGIEATVTRKGPIQPSWAFSSWEPESIASCK